MQTNFSEVQQQQIRNGVATFIQQWYEPKNSFKGIVSKAKLQNDVSLSKSKSTYRKPDEEYARATTAKESRECFKSLLKSGESVEAALSRCQEAGIDVSSLSGYIKKYLAQKSFADEIQGIMTAEGMSPVEVYTKAQIDRKLFSKICGREPYNPSKDTCISLLLALGCCTKTAEDLLSLAGHSLSNHSERDLIIKYCFINEYKTIDKVNEILNMFNLKILRA